MLKRFANGVMLDEDVYKFGGCQGCASGVEKSGPRVLRAAAKANINV